MALSAEANASIRLRRGLRASRRLIKAYGPSNATESSITNLGSILQDQSIVAVMPSTSNCRGHAGDERHKAVGAINVSLITLAHTAKLLEFSPKLSGIPKTKVSHNLLRCPPAASSAWEQRAKCLEVDSSL